VDEALCNYSLHLSPGEHLPSGKRYRDHNPMLHFPRDFWNISQEAARSANSFCIYDNSTPCSRSSRGLHISGISPRFSSQQVSPDREYEVGLRDGSEYYTKGIKEISQAEFWILGRSEPHQGRRPLNGEVMGGAFQGSGAVSEAKFSCQELSSNSKHQVSCFHHT
jgi:hypothetical protein